MRDFILIERIYTLMQTTPKPLMMVVEGFGHLVMEARRLRGIKSVLSSDMEE